MERQGEKITVHRLICCPTDCLRWPLRQRSSSPARGFDMEVPSDARWGQRPFARGTFGVPSSLLKRILREGVLRSVGWKNRAPLAGKGVLGGLLAPLGDPYRCCRPSAWKDTNVSRPAKAANTAIDSKGQRRNTLFLLPPPSSSLLPPSCLPPPSHRPCASSSLLLPPSADPNVPKKPRQPRTADCICSRENSLVCSRLPLRVFVLAPGCQRRGCRCPANRLTSSANCAPVWLVKTSRGNYPASAHHLLENES